jgi:5-oxoprolinase (ATP-hydrolysing)
MMRAMQRQTSGWQFWIDRGGTFTDVVGVAPDGALHVRKVLSASFAGGDPGLRGAREILAAARAPGAIEAVRIGTTVATNALLERKGAPVVLVTTAGFADGLRIGYQDRPDIFALRIALPERLYASVIEAAERIDASGSVLTPLDAVRLREDLTRARSAGARAVAIVLMHGWQFPQHEGRCARIARELGFDEVSVSHELSPLIRYVARGGTTVLNAYLAPPLRGYIDGVQRELDALAPQARFELMQSNGGLAAANEFRAMSSVLSGPAGGLIGMAHIGARLGIPELIGFDMGGTSTDVSLLDGELPRRFEHHIAGVRLQSPMLDVHTIAAGGGSILRLQDGRLVVGPDSAGADPGPACYGRGGPLTLTDAQVALGRLRPDTLPAVFGCDGASAIDPAVVRREFAALASAAGADAARPNAEAPSGATAERGDPVAPQFEALAESFLEVAVESMANAIRQVSTRQGLDAQHFTLFCFGGAAGQHACRVARAAGMRRILVHPLASVLSAFGIGVADRLAVRRASLRLVLSDEALVSAGDRIAELEGDARGELAACADVGEISVERILELRAGDSEAVLSVPARTCAEVQRDFEALHLTRFGFHATGVEPVIEAVRVEARSASPIAASLRLSPATSMPLPGTARVWIGGTALAPRIAAPPDHPDSDSRRGAPLDARSQGSSAGWREVPVLTPEQVNGEVEGPALIVEPHSTFVLEPGWRVQRLAGGELLAESGAEGAASESPSLPTAARIEIFNNLFMHIAEQMGEVLKATAQSVNIKERLDYSCALFDDEGGLVANAPHMPVHLGSMGASVAAIINAHRGAMQPGDSWLLNSPYHGGTHLPDMTVVTPVFVGGVRDPDFFVASRAHHADIGGSTPGSMPPFSATIDEEGVLFEDFQLVTQGVFNASELRAQLANAPYPSRNPDQNVADLRAQLAANARGIAEIGRAVSRHGLPTFRDFMRHVQDNAAECVRNAIDRLRPGEFRYAMDGGQVIAVRVGIDRAARRATLDFTGTSPQGAHNFNAPRAVCIAAVLYVFRTLVDRAIPLNQGCLAPLDIVIPEGCMLDPRPPAAVAAGNVETSQCVVDALYGALGLLAASQGTMNNLTFGNERLQYYETIAGGSGAGPDFDGCDAVQTHMTNSRLTDPEVLESRFPVLLQEFSIRRGSGGSGAHRGGDGVLRRIQFRAPLSGALLANHRHVAPFGMAGGAPASPGAARILRSGGTVESLGATARFDVATGDAIEVLTPGGGGYGAKRSRDES